MITLVCLEQQKSHGHTGRISMELKPATLEAVLTLYCVVFRAGLMLVDCVQCSSCGCS